MACSFVYRQNKDGHLAPEVIQNNLANGIWSGCHNTEMRFKRKGETSMGK
jgi:hypothetical protein